MKSYPKTKAWRSKPYLDFIREQTPLIEGTGDVVPHHLRLDSNAGMGLKPPDSFCLPLYDSTHKAFHAGQESDREFFERHGVDVYAAIQALINKFVGFTIKGDLK